MRTMIRFTVPVDRGNAAISDGSLPKVLTDTMTRLKPEAAYFFSDHGMRSGMMVVDLGDASEIPEIAEPFFTRLGAAVEFIPVMNAEDLKTGLARVGRVAQSV